MTVSHPVSEGEDSVEVIERDRALDLSDALSFNCQEFLDSCRRVQFTVLEDVLEVQGGVLPDDGLSDPVPAKGADGEVEDMLKGCPS